MSELIAIPLESDRRAAEVLAALRWLEAEYEDEGDAGASGADPDAPASPMSVAPDRRPGWRRPLAYVFAALALGALGAAVVLFGGAPPPGVRPVEGATAAGALLVAAAGVLLVAAAGAAPLPAGRRRPADRSRSAPAVTWLVSYLMRDRDAPGARRVRASVLQVTLPAEAEGRLRAILARADATAAR
jgi:hypothetical protein